MKFPHHSRNFAWWKSKYQGAKIFTFVAHTGENLTSRKLILHSPHVPYEKIIYLIFLAKKLLQTNKVALRATKYFFSKLWLLLDCSDLKSPSDETRIRGHGWRLLPFLNLRTCHMGLCKVNHNKTSYQKVRAEWSPDSHWDSNLPNPYAYKSDAIRQTDIIICEWQAIKKLSS